MKIEITSASGSREVDLAHYLDGGLEERAQEDSYRWIKALRHVQVDGIPFRSRFTLRGDSMWWFAELYLHKTQRILGLQRTILAFGALVERERPRRVRARGAEAWLVARLASTKQVPFDGPQAPPSVSAQLLRIGTRASLLWASGRLSRARRRPAPADRATIAAFVHRAFWRSEGDDPGAESYIGPVLREIATRLPSGAVRHVGLGPASNFRARRWWDPLLAGRGSAGIVPIERYAPAAALLESEAQWRRRHSVRRALCASQAVRAHAVIQGCDCWPAVREQLIGVALLQLPWSARAMDEAAAALDALQPAAAVTYAEAGGWGRALALECRRRSIPLAGLQHGFIYRHWLNYRHEPDEMARDATNSHDLGFPRPDVTLLYDGYTKRHLLNAGRFPEASLLVTGSPRLDELVSTVQSLTPEDIASVRRAAGATAAHQSLVVLATKQREAAAVLPSICDAVRTIDDVQLAIKPHPAETPDVYGAVAGGIPNVRVLPVQTPLPHLLAAASAVITINSTVAVDALTLGVPALVVGLPNNLTPFVDAGVMVGASGADEIRLALRRLLYDQEFRRQLSHATEPFMSDFRLRQDGGAAARTAAAVLALAERTPV
jgi:hypothetical protein